MNEIPPHHPAVALALAWQPAPSRPALHALFDLDRRLADLVSRAREPLLAQVRLAWWRDRLSGSPAEFPAGEPLLAELALRWGDRASSLRALVDGWENLLGDEPLGSDAIGAFAEGRGSALAAFADLAGATGDHAASHGSGQAWALAELAWRSSRAGERDAAMSLGSQLRLEPVRSRKLRGVAVLGGLSGRAIARREPIMHGRGAALHAIRLGIIGR